MPKEFEYKPFHKQIHVLYVSDIEPFARQINCRLLNFSSASIFKVLQCSLKLVKMLSECQTARIQVRHRVTWRLIRIQAVCI